MSDEVSSVTRADSRSTPRTTSGRRATDARAGRHHRVRGRPARRHHAGEPRREGRRRGRRRQGLRHHRERQDAERSLRAGQRQDRQASTPTLETKPELVNEDCYGKGWMIVIAPSRPARKRSSSARRRRLRRAPRRPPLTEHSNRCVTYPTRRKRSPRCWRRSAAPRSTSSSSTIPRRSRGSVGRSRSSRRSTSRASCGTSSELAQKNRGAGCSRFLGAGAYDHHYPARGRPAAPAQRVLHGVHAVPARGRAGHAAGRSSSSRPS